MNLPAKSDYSTTVVFPWGMGRDRLLAPVRVARHFAYRRQPSPAGARHFCGALGGAAVKHLVAAAALALLGCGDLKDPTSPPEAAASHTITVSSFQFTADRLEIRSGDRVTWRNAEGFHNVQADDGSFRCAEGCDREGGSGDPSAQTWSFSRVFSDAATVRYFCEVHGGPGGAGMSGMVVVRP